MENLLNFIGDNLLILVAALYVLGVYLKKTPKIIDEFIPWILMLIGIGFAIAINGISPNAILTGVICSFIAVGANSSVKQINKYNNK